MRPVMLVPPHPRRQWRAVVAVVCGCAVWATPAMGANCQGTSTGLTPVSDLGHGRYRGFVGGLYPGASNRPSVAYARAALSGSRLVVPRNAAGAPARGGRIGLLSIGMSNASAEFTQFQAQAAGDPRKSPRVAIIDGAQGGA